MRMTEEQYQALLVRRSASSQWKGSGAHPIASPAPSQKARRSKYGNVKVTDATGKVHDSTKEFRRWQELQLREHAGQISALRRQVPYALVVQTILVCQYVADFVYVDGSTTVVEDVKSDATRKLPAYSIKRKLMQACHNIQIREV